MAYVAVVRHSSGEPDAPSGACHLGRALDLCQYLGDLCHHVDVSYLRRDHGLYECRVSDHRPRRLDERLSELSHDRDPSLYLAYHGPNIALLSLAHGSRGLTSRYLARQSHDAYDGQVTASAGDGLDHHRDLSCGHRAKTAVSRQTCLLFLVVLTLLRSDHAKALLAPSLLWVLVGRLLVLDAALATSARVRIAVHSSLSAAT